MKKMNDISSEKTDLIQEKEKAVFAQEQAHLSEVHHKLKTMEAGLEDRISSIAEKAAAEKLDIRENLALNFDGDSDSMETYIEFEVMNHAIDQYNIDRDTAAEKLGRVKRLLKAPYFILSKTGALMSTCFCGVSLSCPKTACMPFLTRRSQLKTRFSSVL